MTEASTDTTRKIETLRRWASYMPQIADEMERAYRRGIDLYDKLAEAEWLVRELAAHEGAEGLSEYLRERLDKYEFVVKQQEGDHG
jgi:hypothetical protein